MAARCSRITYPAPRLHLLQSFIPKNFLQRRSNVLHWSRFHVCLNFWSCLFVMEWGVMDATDISWRCGHRSTRGFSSIPSRKVGTDGQCCLSHALPSLTWLQGSPVTCVPSQHIDLLLSLPFWAVCFLLVPRGSPEGLFRVSWQGGRHRGYSWPYKGGRWRALKKKKSHTQSFYNSVFIGA